MLTNSNFSVAFVSVYLVVYCVLLHIESTQQIGVFMFALSPLPVIWMVYSVLRYGKYNGRELAEDEEFGYQDRPDLGRAAKQ